MALTVDDLIAHEEIRQCILRHFRAADRVDAELERAAFWDDGHFVGGPVHGPMADIIPSLYGDLLGASFDCTCHYIANLLVTVEGERGRAECYGVGYHLIADRPEALAGVLGGAVENLGPGRWELLVGVRYAIVVERRAGAWRILTMEPVIDWTRIQPQAGLTEGGLPAAIAGRGKRDRTDPTYFGGDWAP